MFRFVAVMLLFSGVFAVRAQDDPTPEPLTFFMTFVPNVQFSQMYVGMEKGYFAEAGFDLTLEYANEPDGVERIALGDLEFGLIAGEQVILARANSRPVVSVYEWWQQYPIVIVADASQVSTPADLAGLRVGLPGRFGATYSGLLAFLAANDLSEQALDLQEIGFNAPEVLCVGGVVASAVYGNNEPLQVQQRIDAGDCPALEAITVLPVVDYVDLVSNGVVTNEMLIAEQPERVARMVSAYDRAVRDVINNPAEAYLISANYIENLPLSEELQLALENLANEQRAFLSENPTRAQVAASREALYTRLSETFSSAELLQLRVLLETVNYWDADTLGYAELSSWELTQQTLLEMGILAQPIDLTAAYTNDFLPVNEE